MKLILALSLLASPVLADPLPRAFRSTVLPCLGGSTLCDFYDKQWNMANRLKVNPWGVPISTPGDINIESVWRESKVGQSSMIVAVIDSGVDIEHPDLAGNIFRNKAEVPGNAIDDDGNGYVDDVHGWNFVNSTPDVSDPVGHGTHIAGIIGARGDNGFGIRGVNWNVQIMPLVYLDAGNHGNMENSQAAIRYAVAMGARIINASWGGIQLDALRETILWAEKKGVLFISSSGNDGENIDVFPYFPASFSLPNMIVVGSSNFDDGITGDSNWGRRTVDILAPGIEILSTLPAGQYGYMSGTSMSAPHVSGAAALIWSENPEWTYKDVKEALLLSSSIKGAYANRVREGRLDMRAALHGPVRAPVAAEGPWQAASDGRVLHYEKAGIYRLTLRAPGAKLIRVRLQSLNIVQGKQRIVVEDARGYILQRFTESQELVTSEYVVGNELTLKFIVDKDGDPLTATVAAVEFL